MIGKIQTTPLLAGLLLTLILASQGLAQSPVGNPPSECECAKSRVQSTGVDDLKTLDRAEKRAEKLREKLLDIELQEISLQSRLDYLDYRLTPANIQWAITFVGSTRPMDELRNELRQRLEDEKAGVKEQVELLASSRERLEVEIRRVNEEIDRLRQQLGLP
jgi:predicted nuclease with TOPRIM domain